MTSKSILSTTRKASPADVSSCGKSPGMNWVSSSPTFHPGSESLKEYQAMSTGFKAWHLGWYTGRGYSPELPLAPMPLLLSPETRDHTDAQCDHATHAEAGTPHVGPPGVTDTSISPAYQLFPVSLIYVLIYF